MRKILLLCLIFIFVLQPTNNIETVSINKDIYTLCGSFGFYKGTIDMSEITTITFTKDKPKSFDECWKANITNTEHIKGYRIDNEVIIVGEYIYANPRCSNMFAAYNNYGDSLWSNLKTINGLELIDTSNVKNMQMMFAFTKLKELNGIENWDVSNVKTFIGMFQGHSNSGDIQLKQINVSDWNTSSAENMSHMFYGCSQLEYIPIENWNVSNVQTFSHMFADCYNLKDLDFSKWKTISVESFDGFLNDCHSLTTIDVSGFEVKTCKQFSQMFEACHNLESIIGLEKWDVSNASHYAFSETFHCCYKLKNIDLSEWKCCPDNTARMFKDCRSLEYINLSGFDTTNIIYDNEIFENCYKLKQENIIYE